MNKRLDTKVFDLPVRELRRGYLSDIYFWREKRALEKHNLHPVVTMQVFQKKNALLCGVDEAIAVLSVATGRYTDYEKAYGLFDRLMDLNRAARECFQNNPESYSRVLKEKRCVSGKLDALWENRYEKLDVRALYDGSMISPWETVMHITGDAGLFAHLETVYLGILSRRTKIATNVREVVESAKGKTVLYFPARFDHWAVQAGDGYAAHVGGAGGVSTTAQTEWWRGKASGTVPHALIAAAKADTVEAVTLFANAYREINLIALVDFDNDCAGTALKCCEALGDRLWGVRLDTSETLVDKSIAAIAGESGPAGVVPELVIKVRETLDRAGFKHVKIVVSGGFSAEKVAHFESMNVPVDAYGVGSSLMRGSFDFTADVVLRNGKPCAKVGRRYNPNPRLEPV